MEQKIKEVAARVIELREICEYTTEDLAHQLGMETSVYEEYEKTGDFPIGVIFGLEKVFRVDFTEILTGNRPILETYQVVRRGHGHPIERGNGSYRYKDLAYNFKDKIMQPTIVTLSPSDDVTKTSSHKGQEFNLVTKGSIIININGTDIALQEGDSVYFNSQLPHYQKCNGEEEARFLAVIAEGDCK